MSRRATIALYACAIGLAALYLAVENPQVRSMARGLVEKAKGCAGCQRRREALGKMFAQAHEAVNWGRTLDG